jgi:RAB protein geranylgeranyltransferase component A
MEAPVEKEEEKRDEEGLLHTYDVILCGTGLVQAILASALARAGKSVLHCDGGDNYGELDAAWNLSMIQEKQENPLTSNDELIDKENVISLLPTGGESSLRWHSKKEVTYFGIQVGCAVQTSFGTGIVKAVPKQQDDSLVVALDKWTLTDGKSPLAYFRIAQHSIDLSSDVEIEKHFFQTHGIQTLRTAKAKQILENDRYLALDATPAFVLATGKAVSGMLASNVADYIEFKTVEGLFWLEEGELSRVPCSKNDVFGTKLLAPMDKRRLMKFIQLSMDYATQLSAAEEMLKQNSTSKHGDSSNTATTTVNNVNISTPETEVQSLNERHLNQGRSLARPQNKAVSKEALQVLQKCMGEEMSFDDFLAQKHKLSPKLRAIVRYALAWEQDVSSTSLSQGMANLRQHLQALGRFGSTALIFPMYGSGELSQAFCRSAAVFGATYLLRRPAIGIRVSEGNAVEGVIVSGDKSEDCPKIAQDSKEIQCSTVVVPSTAVPTLLATCKTRPHKKILRRISVLSSKLIPSDEGDRHVIFIPPQSIGNSHAIHCVTLDDTVQVAPTGCAVMHLTTTVECDAGDDVECTILMKAAQIIVGASQLDVDELYHVTFSHDLTTTDIIPDLPEGVHLCHHSGQVLTADVAFEQAQNIFSMICPGMEFLGLSHELDSCIKERAAEQGYNDDERLILESALDMIGATIGEEREGPDAIAESTVKEEQQHS